MTPAMPERVYDDAVRALLQCPDVREHAHIGIEWLRRMADDLAGDGVFREAVQLAYFEGRADGVAQGRAFGPWPGEHGEE